MTETIAIFAVALAFALLVIGRFERRRGRRTDDAVDRAIDEAERISARQPLMQHPQIDALRCVGCGACVAACPEGDVLAVRGGVAVIVNGSRCVGHGRCETACPVGAIRIGLGAVAQRDDIPTVTDEHESTVPGLFLAGELTGIALIRNAVTHGVACVDAIARRIDAEGRRPGAAGDRATIGIIGAGPAGLAAALRAIELGIDHVVIEQEEAGGTIRHYPRQKLVMTEPVALPLVGRLRRRDYTKEELIELWEDTLARQPIALSAGERLVELAPNDGGFLVRTTGAEHRVRYVILALGRRGTPRKLGVPGEEQSKVAYRLVDATRYADCDLLVVGGGDSAIEAALALAEQPGNRVTLSYRKEAFFRIKARNADRLDEAITRGHIDVRYRSVVDRIEAERVVLRIATPDGDATHTLDNDFVFVFAGGIPPFDLLRNAGVAFGSQPVS